MGKHEDECTLKHFYNVLMEKMNKSYKTYPKSNAKVKNYLCNKYENLFI